jgi:hypothetical protein
MRHLWGIRPLHQILGYRLESRVSAAVENALAREKHLRKACSSFAVKEYPLGWKIGREQFSARMRYVKQF